MRILAIALAALPGAARAQDGFDAHGFHLAAFDGDVRDPLTVQRPGAMARGDWFAGAVLEYADEPLVYFRTDLDGRDLGSEAALDDVFAIDASVGWAVLDRLRVDAAIPLYLASTGLRGSQGVGVGDARLSALLIAIPPGPGGGGLGVGLVPYLDLPLGDETGFLGQGSVAGGAKAAATVEGQHVTITGDIGGYFAHQLALSNVTSTDALTTGLALGYDVDEGLGFTLEAHLAAPFDRNVERGTGAPSEVLLSMRRAFASGPHLLLGGAAAVSHGASAANYRIFLGGGFGRRTSPPAEAPADVPAEAPPPAEAPGPGDMPPGEVPPAP